MVAFGKARDYQVQCPWLSNLLPFDEQSAKNVRSLRCLVPALVFDVLRDGLLTHRAHARAQVFARPQALAPVPFSQLWELLLQLPGRNRPLMNCTSFVGPNCGGKPSVTVGADGAAYIGIRDMYNAVWMGRQNVTAFNGCSGAAESSTRTRKSQPRARWCTRPR